MKKKAIIIFLLLITIINYANAESNKEKNENLIINTFKESKSEFKSFNINYNGKINDKFLDLKEMEYISKNMIESVGMDEVYREVVNESKMNKISIYGQSEENQNITLILYSYLDDKNKKGETTVFIDINESKDYERIEEITSKISKILKKQGIKAEITSCIVGSYDRELKNEYKIKLIDSFIDLTKARQVESLIDDDLVSYSLYSKNIEDYIYSGRNKINLNIAIRYDEYRDQTNIFIASPIITMGY